MRLDLIDNQSFVTTLERRGGEHWLRSDSADSGLEINIVEEISERVSMS